MKIFVYHSNLKDILSKCKETITGMGYPDECISAGRNWLKAERTISLHSNGSFLDLVLKEEAHCTSISVIASRVSPVFGNLHHDRDVEQDFVERIILTLSQHNAVRSEFIFSETPVA